MKRYSKKELKNLVSLGIAANITYLSFSDTEKFLQDHFIEKVGYSAGSYGISGALLKDRYSGDLFAIVSRTPTLLQIM